jgi:ABC-type phosphate/phosphonate transport system substrate-binding protein
MKRFVLFLFFLMTSFLSLSTVLSVEKEVLDFAYSSQIFSGVDSRDVNLTLPILLEKINEKMGLKATFKEKVYQDIDSLIADANDKHLDIIVTTSLDYLKMQESLTATYFPCGVAVKNGTILRKLALITKKTSSIQSLKDLKGSSLIIDTGNKGDITYLWLEDLLLHDTLPPSESFFSAISETTEPAHGIYPVFFGKADACLVTLSSFEVLQELNPQIGKQLYILAESPPLLHTIIAISEHVDSVLKADFEQAMVKVGESIEGQQLLTFFKIDKLKLFSSHHLDEIKKLYEEHVSLQQQNTDNPLSQQHP